jgi:hypothetical protein
MPINPISIPLHLSVFAVWLQDAFLYEGAQTQIYQLDCHVSRMTHISFYGIMLMADYHCMSARCDLYLRPAGNADAFYWLRNEGFNRPGKQAVEHVEIMERTRPCPVRIALTHRADRIAIVSHPLVQKPSSHFDARRRDFMEKKHVVVDSRNSKKAGSGCVVGV